MSPWPIVVMLLLQAGAPELPADAETTESANGARASTKRQARTRRRGGTRTEAPPSRCTQLSRDYAPYAAAWLEASLGQAATPLKKPVALDSEKLRTVARMRLKLRCDSGKLSSKVFKQLTDMVGNEKCLQPPGDCKADPELAAGAAWFERAWRSMLVDKRFWRVQVDCKRVSSTLNEAMILATWPQAVDFTTARAAGAKPVVLRKVKSLCEADVRTWKNVDQLLCCSALADPARCEDECHLNTGRYEPGATTALQSYLGVGATAPPSASEASEAL